MMYLSSVSSRLLLYDTSSWDLKKTYGCYDGLMRDVTWSDDGKYILQVNSKGLIEILTTIEPNVRSVQHIPFKDTWCACFHRDGHRNIAIGTKSGKVMVWDTKTKNVDKIFTPQSHQSTVNHISYNSRNTNLAATLQNGDTIVYSLLSNIPITTVKLSCSKSISAMKFHQDSRTLLGLATEEGHVLLRDTTSGKDKAFFENAHASPVSDFVFSLINKDVLLSSGYDKNVHIYDIRLQNVVSTIQSNYPLTTLSINCENEVAMGTKNGMILIYDLRNILGPTQVLTGHDKEICKVAFQPSRGKSLSTEVSLKEDMVDSHTSPLKNCSPVHTRSSEFLLITETTPKSQLLSPKCVNDSKADSFLVMMGLDKSYNDIDDQVNTSNVEKKSEVDKRKLLDADKNTTRISTPLHSKTVESLGFASPVFINGIGDERRSTNNLLQKPSNVLANIDTKTMDELKDFIKLTVAEASDDNRNYFLHVMMALTKQKLFLEKQLLGMNEQIQTLVNNQNVLVEINQKLTLEIEQLKTQPNKIHK